MPNARDRETVDWIARVGAGGAEHVARRFDTSRRRAHGRLSRLLAEGLLEQRSPLHRGAGLFTASSQGLRWCGLTRLGLHRIGAAGFAHARELAAAAAELERRLAGWRVLGERELRLAEARPGQRLGSARLGDLQDGAPALHRPDLLLLSPCGRRLAVEVELSLDQTRLERVCRAWARAGHIDAVYYLAAGPASQLLDRLALETGAGERIAVLGLGEAPRLASVMAAAPASAGA